MPFACVKFKCWKMFTWWTDLIIKQHRHSLHWAKLPDSKGKGNSEALNLYCGFFPGILVAHYLQSITPALALGGELVYHRRPGEEGTVTSLLGRYTGKCQTFPNPSFLSLLTLQKCEFVVKVTSKLLVKVIIALVTHFFLLLSKVTTM